MALHNLACETTTTTGTASVVLSGAVAGCNTWEDAGVINSETVHYSLTTYNTTTRRVTDREVGTGVYTTADNTLTRATVIASTQSGSKITLTGLSDVAVLPLANDFLTVQEIDGAPSVDNVRILRVTNGSLTDDGGNQVSLDVGAGGGALPYFAMYDYEGVGSGNSILNGSANIQLSIDTEVINGDSIASLGSDVVTILVGGDSAYYRIKAVVYVDCAGIFNGEGTLHLITTPGTRLFKQGWVTASGFRQNYIVAEAVFALFTDDTIELKFSNNSLGSTAQVNVKELSLTQVSALS